MSCRVMFVSTFLLEKWWDCLHLPKSKGRLANQSSKQCQGSGVTAVFVLCTAQKSKSTESSFCLNKSVRKTNSRLHTVDKSLKCSLENCHVTTSGQRDWLDTILDLISKLTCLKEVCFFNELKFIARVLLVSSTQEINQYKLFSSNTVTVK